MLVILIIPLAMLTALALIDVYRKKGSWFLQLICLGILVFIGIKSVTGNLDSAENFAYGLNVVVLTFCSLLGAVVQDRLREEKKDQN